MVDAFMQQWVFWSGQATVTAFSGLGLFRASYDSYSGGDPRSDEGDSSSFGESLLFALRCADEMGSEMRCVGRRVAATPTATLRTTNTIH